MVAQSDRLYGREQAIKLVRELTTRTEVGGSLRNQHFPILVIEGFRGAGKTALLSTLEKLLDQRVPYARLDFEANRHATVPQVLSALAFQLMRKCPRYGVLQFPRFIVGQLVIGLKELDFTDHAKASTQVVEALESLRGIDTWRDTLADTAGSVLTTVARSAGAPVEPPNTVFRLLAKRLVSRAPRRIVLGPFQHWYGHRDLALTNNSVDVLVELNRWACNYADEDNQRRVDDMLLAAFLADLRNDFAQGRRAEERSLNSVILLDNADAGLGRRFLKELVRHRRQRDTDDADPLTVVTTSRGTLLAGVADSDVMAAPEGSRTGQRPRGTDHPRRWWMRYRLPDLTKDEVVRAVAVLGLAQVNNEQLAQVVFQLTNGHPASTRLILDAVASKPPESLIEPEVILSQAPAGEEPPTTTTVEEQMLAQLLVGVSRETLRDVVTCAAARERSHALALAAQDDLVEGGQARYLKILDPILRPTDLSAGPALLRLLLRRRLASRDRHGPEGPPNWSQVYGRLRELCHAKGDETDELYYALADGQLGFVTQRLHEDLAELEHKQWLARLKSVTTAPRRPRQRQVPVDEERSLVDEARSLAREAAVQKQLISLARLIAALWINTDPLAGSDRRDLHLQIAADFTDIVRLTPDGQSAELLQESPTHQRWAEWWG